MKKGPESFTALLQKTKSAVDFQIDVLLAREGSTGEANIMRVAKAVTGTIAKATTAVHQDQLIRQAAARLQLSENALREDIQRLRKKQSPAPRANEETKVPVKISHPIEEVDLLKILAHFPDCAELIRSYLPLSYLRDEDCRTILRCLLEASPDADLLASELTDSNDECKRLGAEIQTAAHKVTDQDNRHIEAAQDLILIIWRKQLEEQRKKLEAERLRATGAKHGELDIQLKQLILDIQLLRQGWEKACPLLELGH